MKADPSESDTDSIPGTSRSHTEIEPQPKEEKVYFGHKFDFNELEALRDNIASMALSPVEGVDGLYVGGLWAMRRSDILHQNSITHVLSMISFDTANLKNFKQEPWTVYGKKFKHLTVDVDDVEDTDMLIQMPRLVRFIREALQNRQGNSNADAGGSSKPEDSSDDDEDDSSGNDLGDSMAKMKLGSQKGGIFIHCAAGISRSVTATIAYLLHTYPSQFDPNVLDAASSPRPRRETAQQAVWNALALIRRTRPVANPNTGFMEQLRLWWEMGCPVDSYYENPSSTEDKGSAAANAPASDKDPHNPVEHHPLYQKWAFNREVKLHTDIGQAPPHLVFSDEFEIVPPPASAPSPTGQQQLKCKKCRRLLVSSDFLIPHTPRRENKLCQHHFIEPLSWMKEELEKGAMAGRLTCPNVKCGASVGRYDWKGFGCSCSEWVVPGFSLQKGRVDESTGGVGGVRMPPGAGRGNL